MSGLRVIAGMARGRRLRPVPGESTRPITDRTKESLFNIIGGDVQGAAFLDLFAGTGSVGIEALSRGAGFVLFVDIHPMAVKTVRENLEHTGLASGADVLKADALHLLEKPSNRKFDYVYVAPPQYKSIWKRVVQSLDKYTDWLSEDAWVIAQIHPVEYEQLALSQLQEFDKRKYGSTLLVFFERSAG